jgi:membrane protein DedA with SNARE-associated domain
MSMLASIDGIVGAHRQWALVLMFVLLALESFGLPLPGETALIACGVLASEGSLSISMVIGVAAVAAIIGDNLGYWVARRTGRTLLYRSRLTRRYVETYLPRGERFFARHGGEAVFLGRFVAVLRVTAAWSAGLTRMGWWRFLLWNAAGGLVWAATVGVATYYLGAAAAHAIGRYGLIGTVGVLLFGTLGYVIVRRLAKRALRRNSRSSPVERMPMHHPWSGS